MARARLVGVVQDADGDVQAGASVHVYEADGVTALAATMYAANTGVTTLTNPLTTDAYGKFEAFADVGQRVTAICNGRPLDLAFEYDPADILTTSSLSGVVTLTGTQSITGTKTLTSPVLTTPVISTLTTLGDLLVGAGSGVLSRLGIGTAFQELGTNAAANGLQWVTGPIKLAAAAGDTFYATGANALAKLAKGTAFQELTMNTGATAPQWSDGVLALAAAAGDTFYATAANVLAKLAKGTAYQEMTMNAAATAPQWSSGPLALAAAAGDTFHATAANVVAKLTKGTAFQEYTMNSGATLPQWSTGVLATVTAAGDLTYATAANVIARLAKGTAFQQLGMNSGATAPAWQTGCLAIVTAAGDVIYASAANTLARLAKGSDGQILTLASGLPSWTNAAQASVYPANPIINGGFNFWQRGTSFISVATGTYLADRWVYTKVGSTAVHDISRSTDVPAVATAVPLQNYSILVDCQTADAAVAVGDVVAFGQKIEGFNFLPYAQRQFTLSFWVKATKTGTYCVAFRNGAGDRSYVAEYTVSVSATWEQKSVTVSASPSAGTWDYTNGIGLTVDWCLMGGSTFQTTAGAWQAGNFLCTSSQVNATDANTNDFRIALAQIDLGATALAFSPRSYPQELALCQRYCEKNVPLATAPQTNATALLYAVTTASIANGSVYLAIPFAVRKRATAGTALLWPYTTAANSGRSSDGTATDYAATSASGSAYEGHMVVANASGGALAITASLSVYLGWMVTSEL